MPTERPLPNYNPGAAVPMPNYQQPFVPAPQAPNTTSPRPLHLPNHKPR